jgi:hypothetical protein
VTPPRCSDEDVSRALDALHRAPVIVSAAEWPMGLDDLDKPGLYSWWVDASGAADLAAALNQELTAGRIYAGQTGATNWPSGRVGSMTLRQRLGGNHLRGSIRGSTFRRTLGACLVEPLGLALAEAGKLTPDSERRLRSWMQTHLRVAVHPYPDRDALGDLERRVLAALDPPLNLEGMPRTVRRERLTALRRRLIEAHAPPRRSGKRPLSRDVAPTMPSAPRTTLHEEIATILRESGRPMTTAELADAVNERGIYSRRDKSWVTSFQIHGRTRNYPRLFDRDGQLVRLRS